MNLVWTDGYHYSIVRPIFLPMPTGVTYAYAGVTDEHLRQAGWWQEPYNEEKFLNPPISQA